MIKFTPHGKTLDFFTSLFLAQKVLQAATFDWQSDHGASTGSPAKGTTRSTGRTEFNHKSIDDSTTAYTAAPITDGTNSYEIWGFGKFTGTFNQILSGLWAHTAGTISTGCTLKGNPATTGDGDRPLYTTPSQTANSNLSQNMSSVIAIGSGVAVFFGATGPEATGKASSSTNATTYTNYLPTQLQVSGASPGDTTQMTLTLQYAEN